MTIRAGVMAMLALMGGASVAAAQTILDIIGADGRAVAYDADRLAALPQHRIVTHTSVTDGPQSFSGPLMRDLLADAGISADSVLAIALNDYEIAIPTADFTRFDVIAAMTMNDQALTPRDKGPIWIVYPRDDHAELHDILYDHRWVWQLTRLEAQ